jgi:hypothetical protein
MEEEEGQCLWPLLCDTASSVPFLFYLSPFAIALVLVKSGYCVCLQAIRGDETAQLPKIAFPSHHHSIHRKHKQPTFMVAS